jgi:hypothetical protein
MFLFHKGNGITKYSYAVKKRNGKRHVPHAHYFVPASNQSPKNDKYFNSQGLFFFVRWLPCRNASPNRRYFFGITPAGFYINPDLLEKRVW